MTTFLLIRHGETGIEEKTQKPEDSLSKQGFEQAKKLAKQVKAFSVESIYASPYQRALRTAEILASVFTPTLIPISDDRLIEISLWVDPVDLHDDTSEEYKRSFAVLNEAWERVGELLKELRENHQGETIALVCHGNLIRAIVGYALKMSLESIVRLKVDLVSVSVLEWVDEGYFRLSLFNDTCHLRNEK
ncbi:MAG: histidine phosphatase family protein [Candidatus Cloacimonetes bacterium]|nr:histidine phosphatase family protein [Candidatus Cloacimonadota bacterium]